MSHMNAPSQDAPDALKERGNPSREESKTVFDAQATARPPDARESDATRALRQEQRVTLKIKSYAPRERSTKGVLPSARHGASYYKYYHIYLCTYFHSQAAPLLTGRRVPAPLRDVR